MNSPESGLPIHCACTAGNMDIVSLLASMCPESLGVDNASVGLPIHCACTAGNIDIVSLLASMCPESLDVDNASVGLPLNCADSEGVIRFLHAKRYATVIAKGTPPLHAILRDKDLRNKGVITSNFTLFLEPMHLIKTATERYLYI